MAMGKRSALARRGRAGTAAGPTPQPIPYPTDTCAMAIVAFHRTILPVTAFQHTPYRYVTTHGLMNSVDSQDF